MHPTLLFLKMFLFVVFIFNFCKHTLTAKNVMAFRAKSKVNKSFDDGCSLFLASSEKKTYFVLQLEIIMDTNPMILMNLAMDAGFDAVDLGLLGLALLSLTHRAESICYPTVVVNVVAQ